MLSPFPKFTRRCPMCQARTQPAEPPPQEMAGGFGRLPGSIAGCGHGHFPQYPSVLDDLFD